MRTRIFLSAVLLFILAQVVWTQPYDESKLQGQLSAIQQYGNRIKIRWAPLNYYTFRMGADYGYELQRIQTHANGELLPIDQQSPTFTVLGAKILPKGINDWGGVNATEDYIDVAKAALYSNDFTASEESNEMVKAYNLNTERINRYNFGLMVADQSFLLARAMGLGWINYRPLTTGDAYTFTLFVNTPTGKVLLGSISVDQNLVQHRPAIETPDLQGSEKVIQITWPIEKEGTPYVSYDVQRKYNNEGWQVINDKPLIFIDQDNQDQIMGIYVDEVPELNLTYSYRLIGRTSFGPRKWSGYAKIIPRRPPVLAASIDKVEELTLNKFSIEYDFPASFNTEINSVKIHRSDRREGPYEVMKHSMHIQNRSTVVEFVKPVNYIKIVLDDKYYGDISSLASLVQLKDITPPHKPSLTDCTCDQEGKVSLSWPQNNDLDLKGYRVWFSNQKNGHYAEVTSGPISDTTHTDYITVATLSEEIFYKVSAIDFHENEGPQSDPCTVKRPDIIPPSEPVLSSADGAVEAIRLEWNWSMSGDVARHELERKRDDEWNWSTIETFINPNGASYTYIDSAVTYEHSYSYRLLAYDEVDNVSSSSILTAQPFDDLIRGDILRFQADLSLGPRYSRDQRDQIARLSWAYPTNENLENFVLYRQINDGPMITYKTLNKETGLLYDEKKGKYFWDDLDLGLIYESTTALDPKNPTEVKGERQLSYQIMARHTDGGYSNLSEVIYLMLQFRLTNSF